MRCPFWVWEVLVNYKDRAEYSLAEKVRSENRRYGVNHSGGEDCILCCGVYDVLVDKQKYLSVLRRQSGIFFRELSLLTVRY